MRKRFVWNFFDPEKVRSVTHFDYDSFLETKCTNSTLRRPVTNQSFICCCQLLLWFIWFDEMCHHLSHFSDNNLLYDSSMTHFGKAKKKLFEKFQSFLKKNFVIMNFNIMEAIYSVSIFIKAKYSLRKHTTFVKFETQTTHNFDKNRLCDA